MKKTFKSIVLSAALVAGFILPSLAFTAHVSAVDVFSQACGGSTNSNNGGNQNGGGNSNSSNGVCGASSSDTLQGFTTRIINTLFVVIGIIAVIMIVIGGIRYTTSNGDANQTKSAKDTILYAVIGLVVAIMAFAIVNFVVGAFK